MAIAVQTFCYASQVTYLYHPLLVSQNYLRQLGSTRPPESSNPT